VSARPAHCRRWQRPSTISLTGFGAAVTPVAALALLAALVWSTIIQLTLPRITITVGLFTFVLNGLLVLLGGALIGEFEVASFWWALLVAVVVTIVDISVGGVLIICDDHVWRQRVVRRLVARRENVEPTDVPAEPTTRSAWC